MKLFVIFMLIAITFAEFKHKKSKKWAKHSSKFKLSFTNDHEEAIAFDNYEITDKMIESNNLKQNAKYKLAHNEFSHLSDEEFNQRMNGLTNQKISQKRDFYTQEPIDSTGFQYKIFKKTIGKTLPDNIDLVNMAPNKKNNSGWNTPVHNQICGNCWAHSAVGAAEYALFKALDYQSYADERLSFQELTDCDRRNYGNGALNKGCSGGFQDLAFIYMKNNGIHLLSDYPESNSTICRTIDAAKVESQFFKGYVAIEGYRNSLMEALMEYGAISVGIDASGNGIKSYKDGLWTNCVDTINHAVLLVGYGKYNQQDAPSPNLVNQTYWKIKNSWGSAWGMNGYMHIPMGGACGMYTQSSHVPLIDFN